jgi:hypothetical protein
MPNSILNIVNTAYRATLEEQDDTVVWLSRALRGAGAPVDILLQGAGVNYAVNGQNAAGLRFGDWVQKNPPNVASDLAGFVAKGGTVMVVQEDLAERGIEAPALMGGIQPIDKGSLATLFARYDAIWNW